MYKRYAIIAAFKGADDVECAMSAMRPVSEYFGEEPEEGVVHVVVEVIHRDFGACIPKDWHTDVSAAGQNADTVAAHGIRASGTLGSAPTGERKIPMKWYELEYLPSSDIRELRTTRA
ncbi:hypothetical protein SCP_0600650 [Sparassis crispa]|uniref:Uncharacterized protein n=1 Tax=Sparassis crispa TaxID=139825 RepID=A0A401GPE1_9APHY|nr:hypothetical protein SCP_0600650 [Sparassis crispa]GBE84087.1 hypothetical protein SCP_0600650 [Sparassis crispa]